jgi:hypothetical protein
MTKTRLLTPHGNELQQKQSWTNTQQKSKEIHRITQDTHGIHRSDSRILSNRPPPASTVTASSSKTSLIFKQQKELDSTLPRTHDKHSAWLDNTYTENTRHLSTAVASGDVASKGMSGSKQTAVWIVCSCAATRLRDNCTPTHKHTHDMTTERWSHKDMSAAHVNGPLCECL